MGNFISNKLKKWKAIPVLLSELNGEINFNKWDKIIADTKNASELYNRNKNINSKIVVLKFEFEETEPVFENQISRPILTWKLESALLNISLRRKSPKFPEIHKTIPEDIKKLKVLIAEDNNVNKILLKHILISIGINQITEANNGLEAVESFKIESPDIIFMDVQMPILDGLEATEMIRKIESDKSEETLIIALTANAMEGDKEKCIKAGMNDYLSKPFLKDQILNILLKYSIIE